jgi:hypothetical protein
MTTMWRMAQRRAGRGIGQPALDRPQDSQRESLVRYFRVGAVGQWQGRRAAAPAPNTFSQEWANYIAARIKRSEDHTLRISMETVGKVLAEERDKLRAEFRCELEREVAALRNEFLQDRLDAARSTQKIKAVQSSPVALIA